jgi:hypothetical protein
MKVTFEFDLPEAQEDFEMYSKAPEFYNVLFEINEWLRTQIKHHDKEEYIPVREQLSELMRKYGIDF